jgi:hypothetical protein
MDDELLGLENDDGVSSAAAGRRGQNVFVRSTPEPLKRRVKDWEEMEGDGSERKQNRFLFFPLGFQKGLLISFSFHPRRRGAAFRPRS